MKLNRNSIIYTAVFTFVVCILFVVILAVANQVTIARVNTNKKLESQVAVLKAFGLADSSTPAGEIDSKYSQFITEKTMDKATASSRNDNTMVNPT